MFMVQVSSDANVLSDEFIPLLKAGHVIGEVSVMMTSLLRVCIPTVDNPISSFSANSIVQEDRASRSR